MEDSCGQYDFPEPVSTEIPSFPSNSPDLAHRAHSPTDAVVPCRRKSPYKMSGTRKMRARLRLKSVDEVIATVQESGVACSALDKALELLTESEMRPKDKYSTFSRTSPGYRKSLHKVRPPSCAPVDGTELMRRLAGAEMDPSHPQGIASRILVAGISSHSHSRGGLEYSSTVVIITYLIVKSLSALARSKCDKRNKMQILIQHQLHPPRPQTLHYPLVPQYMSENVLPRFRHVQQRAILRVEMRHVQNEMRKMGEEQGI